VTPPERVGERIDPRKQQVVRFVAVFRLAGMRTVDPLQETEVMLLVSPCAA